MSQQFLRAAQLIVADDIGNGLDLSQLRIQFWVKSASTQSLKQASIRVYNLKPESARKLEKEFTQVRLQVGYGDDLALLFQGQIAHLRRGRANALDSFVEMLCQDGDEAYNFAVVSTTLAAGWKPKDAHKALTDSLAPYKVLPGYVGQLNGNAAPRGKVLFGMARDQLRTLAASQKSGWGIEDGRLNFVELSSTMPVEVPVLNAASGLLGVPEVTIDGIVVKCLMNPRIRSFGKLQIDNAAITSLQIRQQLAGEQPVIAPTLDADGFYVAHCVVHNGDTRGNDWFTQAICVAVDGTAPLGGSTLVDVPNGY